ncbi:MAG: DUF4118 domain-containing protein [Proteobacteria bacterium]|uniref:DUF4118 domain-containing protein n=1 Tax=Aquabacterium sp. TaxID=1872578 RepID=UPI0035C71E25|nr:DUF4118 domain-containing protein [Pseudomonadota bacterium]
MPRTDAPLPAQARPPSRWRYPLAAAACGATTVATTPLHDWLEPVNAVMLFLFTVVLVAARLGRGPAVMAAFLSVGLFDFFYVPPRFSFAVSDIQYLLTFAVMLAVALLIAQLALGMRQRADEALQAARRAQALHALAHQLAGALTASQVLAHLRAFVHGQLHATLQLWLPGPGQTLERIEADPGEGLSTLPAPVPSASLALLAQSVVQDSARPGPHRLQDEDGHHVLLPLLGSTRKRGVMLVSEAEGHRLQAHAEMLDAVGALAATALERLHFVEVAHQSELDMQTERLRNAILSALSHDVRTPLTALVGMAETLSLLQPPLSPQAREMAEALRGQALRLHDMVSKLLDMARLQATLPAPSRGATPGPGRLPLRLEWQPIEEVIGASIQLLAAALARHRVAVDLPCDLPLVALDAVLMERVFGNLLDNAAKYAPPDTDIQLAVRAAEGWLQVSVHNAGTGFPPERLHEVFELFARGEPEGHVPGMGLGLAICKAIVEAHGGRIDALNPPTGGAEVRLQLPLGTPPAIEPEPA